MSSRARRMASDRTIQPYDWGAVQDEAHPEPAPAAQAPTAGPARASEPADDQAHLAALERDAFAKGYAQGERAGAEVAAKRGEAMLRRLTETLEELGSLRAEMIRRTERQTVQLALAIAKRILDREISLDRGLIVAMARVALDRLGEQASATIRLHPDDHAVVMAAGAGESADQVKIVADPVISRGGCLVESDFGYMEVATEAQFAALARTLLGEVDPAAPPDNALEGNGVVIRK